MARKRKTPKKGKKASSSSKSPSVGFQMLKVLLGTVILVGFVVVAGILAGSYLAGPKKSAPEPVPTASRPVKAATTQTASSGKPVKYEIPKFEVFPEAAKVSPADPLRPEPESVMGPKRPKMAIVIDDLGYDPAIAKKLMRLNAVLTFAVLPRAPYQKKIADAAHKNGFEIMLHMPMEPKEYPRINPGPGALLAAMEPDRLIETLRDNLRRVPHIRGVNNHMGSRLTGISDKMNQVFSELKQNDLFFIDSLTTSHSKARQSARLFKVPYAERSVFLDHTPVEEQVRKQFRRLLASAHKYGEAIGIGHPYTVTLDVLREKLPDAKQEVELVPASQLVHIIQ